MNINLITIAQTAEMLGITRQAVLGLVRRGRIPATLVGSYYILNYQDVVVYQQQKAAREASR